MHPKIQGLVCCLNYVYNPNANSVVHWWVMVFGQPLHFGKSWHHPWFCKLLTIWHNIFLLNGVCDLLLPSNTMKKKFHQVFMKQEAGKLILPGSRQTDFRLQTPSEIKITILYLSISHMKKLLDVRCNNNIFGKLSR